MKKLKIPAVLFLMAIIASVAHNLVYAALKIEEPVFFALAFVFLIASMVTLVLVVVKGRG